VGTRDPKKKGDGGELLLGGWGAVKGGGIKNRNDAGWVTDVPDLKKFTIPGTYQRQKNKNVRRKGDREVTPNCPKAKGREAVPKDP